MTARSVTDKIKRDVKPKQIAPEVAPLGWLQRRRKPARPVLSPDELDRIAALVEARHP
jgi:hypothetical protein